MAAHYWHSNDADGTALQLYTRLDIPNVSAEKFNITILYHMNFTGNLDYNEAQQYGKLGQHVLCFSYRDNDSPHLRTTLTPPAVTPKPSLLYQLKEPLQLVRTQTGTDLVTVNDRRGAFDLKTSEYRYNTTKHPGNQFPSYSTEVYHRCLQTANWHQKTSHTRASKYEH